MAVMKTSIFSIKHCLVIMIYDTQNEQKQSYERNAFRKKILFDVEISEEVKYAAT